MEPKPTSADGSEADTTAGERVNYGRRIWAGFAAAIVTSAVAGSATYFLAYQASLSADWVAHTHIVIEHLDALTLAVQDVQMGARTYILTGNESALRPYLSGRWRVAGEIATLRQLTRDRAEQQPRLTALKEAVGLKLALVDRVIAARKANDARTATEIALSGNNEDLTERIRQEARAMTEDENSLLRARVARENFNTGLLSVIILFGGAGSLLMMSFAGVFIHRMIEALRSSLGKLASSQAEFARRSQVGLDRFRKLIDMLPEALVMANQRGEVLLVNSRTEQLFGYKREELLGRPVENLIPERLRAAHPSHREGYFAQPVSRSMGVGRDLVGLCKDGAEVPIEVSLGPVESDEGLLVASLISDITQRKQLERELMERQKKLVRSNAELEQFAYVASHDLQEPLRMVASYVQLLAQRYRGRLDADADEFIQFAVDGATRMKTLISDLLAYSRVGTHGKPPQKVELDSALGQALSNLTIAVQEARAEITNDRLPVVTGDELQLTELFQNLIGNALKFRRDGSAAVHIGAERRADEWVISVRDNGIGIDPQYKERIFVIFQRLHGRDEYPGTGIGLAICQKIVTRHGGRIWVESKPGEGATFRFTIPAPIEEARAA